MEIHLGSDHRGFGLKRQIAEYLTELGHHCTDHGCHSEDRADYPDYAKPVGLHVGADPEALGIVICGSGAGIAIAANKVKGVRCVPAWTEHIAEYAKRHNHANVLAFSADLQTWTQVKRCLDAFLAAEPEGGRHAERVAMITRLEDN